MSPQVSEKQLSPVQVSEKDLSPVQVSEKQLSPQVLEKDLSHFLKVWSPEL